MGQGMSGGSANVGIQSKGEKIQALVVEDIKILTKEYEVKVPKFVEKIVEVPKYVEKTINVTHVNIINEDLIVKNVEVQERVVETDKVRFVDVFVDRPVYVHKEVTDYVVKKVEYPVEVPKLIEKTIVKEVPFEVKTYKLVEEVIKVPKLIFVPTEVERVVWKDVPRERCSHCGKNL